jgi:RHS repeat-associated protein
MGVTNYFSANGMLLGEDGPNGKVGYLTDALGSVTSTLNQAGAVLNTYRYKPYGSQLSKTGTAPDPEFSWVGLRGYRQTGLDHTDIYIRRRHFSSIEGRWTTVDALWPTEPPFAYAGNRPVRVVDPTGAFGVGGCLDWKAWVQATCQYTNDSTGARGPNKTFWYCAGCNSCACTNSPTLLTYCNFTATESGSAFGNNTVNLQASFNGGSISASGTMPYCNLFHRFQNALSAIPVAGSFLGVGDLLQDVTNAVTAFQQIAPWGQSGYMTTCALTFTLNLYVAIWFPPCKSKSIGTCNKGTPGFPGIAGKALNALSCGSN